MGKIKNLKIALICGGPSLERGISLNSARSVCDHLHSAARVGENFGSSGGNFGANAGDSSDGESDGIEVLPLYFDHDKKPYLVSRGQLYSNTPSDFDFKLQQTAKPLSETGLQKFLKSVDLAFPVMHGEFGEDGGIQKMLQKLGVPYVGSGVDACQNCFDKFRANNFIRKQGFFTLPSEVLKINKNEENLDRIREFFKEYKLDRAIVKPATGGSSIGVYSVSTVEEAAEAARAIFNKRIDTRVVLEPFCRGTEFTVIILQNRFGMPVALFPTEIEADYQDHQIFDFRKKYLATRQVTYHCPPRFSDEVIEKIQVQAEQLFQILGMRHFARFDGWLLDDGKLWFSDFNPISGMEQNSFLFLQAAQLGFSHGDLLQFVVRNTCKDYGIEFPEKIEESEETDGAKSSLGSKVSKKQRVNVLFGGATSERQVSVMSGTNAWLKLRKSEKYEPHPYLLDTDGETVWELPYSRTLNHTVEEISEMCKAAEAVEKYLAGLRRRVLTKIAARPGHLNEELFVPRKMTLKEFIENSKLSENRKSQDSELSENSSRSKNSKTSSNSEMACGNVFIGLHGGIGENGVLQKMLEDADIKFNGSGSEGSKICADKYKTGLLLEGLENEGIYVPKKQLVSLKDLIAFSKGKSVAGKFSGAKNLADFWKNLKQELGANDIIVKPPEDGCSTGIIKLESSLELEVYLKLLESRAQVAPKGTFKNQYDVIEMPTEMPESLMFEKFIKTDRIRMVKNQIKWERVSDWIEITMGVLEVPAESTKLHALNPSLTVASGAVLTVEEKFQGGTGVNITPPPQPYVKKSAIEKARKRMEIVAAKLKIKGYARIDSFMNTQTGELLIIEANTTPALTPSTVIFHQALAEEPEMYPTEFLEKVVGKS